MISKKLPASLFIYGLLLTNFCHTFAQSGPAESQLAREPQAANRSGKDAFPVNPFDVTSRQFPVFLQRMAEDQREFWKAPLVLRRPEAFNAFLPWAGITSVLMASDVSLSRKVPANFVGPSRGAAQYGTYGLAASTGAFYAIGNVTHNDHLREAGLISGEAALNTLLVSSMLQLAIAREPPNEAEAGKLGFQRGGNSFPAEHAAIAWSIASAIAHEYPGPMTKFVAYGLASSVTAASVTGKQHFPSDAVAGSLLGWYVGRQIYQRRHNAELGGASWEGSDYGATETEPRPPEKMGSPYVALDSWVYPAFERLAALGYVQTAFLGLRPWTRMECAQLLDRAQENYAGDGSDSPVVLDLDSALQQEFRYELELLKGGSGLNRTVQLESAYARAVSISGPPLTDGFHFGQTLADDFGRPFRRGGNVQLGASFRGALGPAALYVRGEFQHAPAAQALSDSVRTFIAAADLVTTRPSAAFAPINRARLLDAYVALNLRRGWQLSFGKQSLFWAPGPGESFVWSNNIEPIPMLRLTQSQMYLPGLLRLLGPARVDSFFGRLDGHTHVPRPFIYGNKINFKLLPNLELGFGRTVQIGGRGGDPLTIKNFLLSFVGRVDANLNSVPGDSNSNFDWTFYVPRLRNYVVFYGELYADDDFVPFQNLPKNPFRSGIYLTRFPRLPRLDLHLEAASTESPGFRGNHGNLNYWNHKYRDGYTNNGNLIGHTVGRMGRSFQCWFNYWFSAQNTLQFTYKHNTVRREFIPQGGAWQDYSLQSNMTLRSGVYLRSRVQYEHLCRYPLLFSGPRNNVSVVLELGFLSPKWH